MTLCTTQTHAINTPFLRKLPGLFFKGRKFLSQRSETVSVVMCQCGDRKSCVCIAVPDGVRSQETLTKKEISSPTIMTTRVMSQTRWPVCGRPLAGAAFSSPVVCMEVCCECCVLSDRDLCDGPIPRPEE